MSTLNLFYGGYLQYILKYICFSVCTIYIYLFFLPVVYFLQGSVRYTANAAEFNQSSAMFSSLRNCFLAPGSVRTSITGGQDTARHCKRPKFTPKGMLNSSRGAKELQHQQRGAEGFSSPLCSCPALEAREQ